MYPPPLPYGKSWRVKSKPQVRNCRSQICRSLTLLKSPPSAPAHSARPTQNDRGPGFCDFQKTIASAERGAKKLCPTDPVANLCQKWQATRHHLHNFYVPTHFSHHIFSKKCFSPQWGAHFRKTTSSTFDHFFTFFPPKRPQKEHFFPLYLLFSLFWPFRSLFFRFLSPLEF